MIGTFAACLLSASVVLPAEPTAVERSAAAELSDAFFRMSGWRPAVVREGEPSDAPRFYVGATRTAAAVTNAEGITSWNYDEILVRPVSDGVVLTGHSVRGPIYAADTLLEDGYGVRWWSPEEADYPCRQVSPVPALSRRHTPTFRYRETYYRDSFDAAFKVRTKGNFSSLTRYMLRPMEFVPPEKGGNHRMYYFKGRRSAYHSFFEILPPERYFRDHPEWYSEYRGRRQPLQLCLTDEKMTAEFIRETKRLLREDRSADFISISQNDSSESEKVHPCTCAKCRALEKATGGVHSGPIIAFANRVAEGIEDEFPDVTVDTFAYAYSSSAPQNILARHNVSVRLCNIGCPFSFPLETEEHFTCADYRQDLERWGKIAPGRLFLWDYVTNFSSYMLPHPNLYSLGPNVRLFARSGAVGVFEQGDALCTAGAFNRLKQYVLTHLLWDASRDDGALIREFVNGYYGPSAAPHVLAYLELVNRPPLIAKNTVGCYHANVDTFMFPATIHLCWRKMTEALAAAERDGVEFARRVRREKISIDHAVILNWDKLRDWYYEGWPAWPFGESRAEAVRRWAEECRTFGVTAYRETTEANFEPYVRALLSEVTIRKE